MSRNALIAIGLAVIAVLIGAVSFLMQSRAMPEAVAAPNYAAAEAWSHRPATPTKAVWDGGWDVDVFLISPSSAMVAAMPAKAANLRARAVTDAAGMAGDLGSVGQVYAPIYRDEARETDVQTALIHYLKSDSRGRAFVIALDAPLPQATFAAIDADPLIKQRFGGFFVLVPRAADLSVGDALSDFDVATTPKLCAGAAMEEQNCVRAVVVQKRSGRLTIDAEETGLNDWRAHFLASLESEADQLAMPLGEAEFIAPSDIRSPGDTDEARGTASPN